MCSKRDNYNRKWVIFHGLLSHLHCRQPCWHMIFFLVRTLLSGVGLVHMIFFRVRTLLTYIVGSGVGLVEMIFFRASTYNSHLHSWKRCWVGTHAILSSAYTFQMCTKDEVTCVSCFIWTSSSQFIWWAIYFMVFNGVQYRKISTLPEARIIGEFFGKQVYQTRT